MSDRTIDTSNGIIRPCIVSIGQRNRTIKEHRDGVSESEKRVSKRDSQTARREQEDHSFQEISALCLGGAVWLYFLG
jgi:hypothetical protein